MLDTIEKGKKEVQDILDGKIGCLDIIYNCCINEFNHNHSESSWITDECHKYIYNYFIKLGKKISDLSIEKFMLLTNEESKCIRYLCKVDDGSNQSISHDVRIVFNKFRKVVMRDVNFKVEYLMKELCNGNSDVLNSEIIGLLEMNVNLGVYNKAKFYLIYDCIKLTKEELRSYFGDENYRAIVKSVHSYGFRFADELSDAALINLCSPCLDEKFARLEELEGEKKDIIDRLRAIDEEENKIIAEISESPSAVDRAALRKYFRLI